MAEAGVEIFTARRIIALADAEPEAFAVLGERIVATGLLPNCARASPTLKSPILATM